MIKLTFTYTKKEYVQAVRNYLMAAKLISKFNLVFIVLFVLFSIYYTIATGFNILSTIALIVSVFAFAIGMIAYFWMPIKTYQQVLKLHETYHLGFSQESIEFKTATIDSTLQWSTYTQVWKSSQCFYLIQTTNVYSVIPLRVFKDEEEIKAFESMASEHIDTIRYIK